MYICMYVRMYIYSSLCLCPCVCLCVYMFLVKTLCFSFSFPTPENDGFRYITVLISVLGLIMTDLFYLAAVIHYALECQLIIFLIRATVDRIKSQCWAVDLAIKVHTETCY